MNNTDTKSEVNRSRATITARSWKNDDSELERALEESPNLKVNIILFTFGCTNTIFADCTHRQIYRTTDKHIRKVRQT